MPLPGGLVSGGFAGSALACIVALSAVSGTVPVISRLARSAGSDRRTCDGAAPLPSGKLNICDAHDSIDDDGCGTSAVVRMIEVPGSRRGALSVALRAPPSSNRSAAFNANRQEHATTGLGMK